MKEYKNPVLLETMNEKPRDYWKILYKATNNLDSDCPVQMNVFVEHSQKLHTDDLLNNQNYMCPLWECTCRSGEQPEHPYVQPEHPYVLHRPGCAAGWGARWPPPRLHPSPLPLKTRGE